MKIERIDKNKIKVLIDDAEAKEWNITVKNISDNTPEVQRMFWQAINLAKTSVDFSVDGAKLFVEAIPSNGDGIGMMITRVCSNEELETAVNSCAYKGKLRFRELKQNEPAPVRRRKYIYKFESFDTVCAAASDLGHKYNGTSTLYKMADEYYLYLVPSNNAAFGETNIILSEFAERIPHSQYAHGKLNEYGNVLIGTEAIDVLQEYFA